MGFKKIPITNIHNNKTYKMPELAKVLKVCVSTIWNWVQKGLPVINRDSKPLYFDGHAVKEYLLKKHKSRKIFMQDHECFCVKCRKPREVVAESIKVFSLGYLDKNKFIRSIKIVGHCIRCGSTIVRFSTEGLLFGFLDYYMINRIDIIESKKQTPARRKGIHKSNERESN